MSIAHISDDTFDSEVLQADKPVLVDFWADWCGPCKMIAPVVEELAEEYDGKFNFTKVDVDANPQTAINFGIRSIPTLLIFKDGKLSAAATHAKLSSMVGLPLDTSRTCPARDS